MSNDDYLSISADDLEMEDDTITLTGWNSTLSTTLTSGGYSLSTASPTLSVSPSSSGVTGATLSTSLTGGLMWNNPTYTATASPYSINDTISASTIQHGRQLYVGGDATIDGDLTVKGVKLNERLDAIEERLGILRPNNDLEGKWEKLKALGEEYRKMEKEILEQESMWDILKK